MPRHGGLKKALILTQLRKNAYTGSSLEVQNAKQSFYAPKEKGPFYFHKNPLRKDKQWQETTIPMKSARKR